MLRASQYFDLQNRSQFTVNKHVNKDRKQKHKKLKHMWYDDGISAKL